MLGDLKFSVFGFEPRLLAALVIGLEEPLGPGLMTLRSVSLYSGGNSIFAVFFASPPQAQYASSNFSLDNFGMSVFSFSNGSSTDAAADVADWHFGVREALLPRCKVAFARP